MKIINIEGQEYEEAIEISGIETNKCVFYKGKWYKPKKEEPKEWEILSYKSGDYIVDVNLEYCSRWNYPIHSVKRLLDGEIFTVGDVVKGYGCPYKVDSINILIGQCYINGDGASYNIVNVQKQKKVPLFTTEDGIDIYEGHSAFYIEEENDYKTVFHGNICNKNDRKYFSTSKAAKEYILYNKKSLSLQDVKDNMIGKDFIGTDFLINKLKENVARKS